MNGPAPHTQLDADLAAGMGMPDNGPKFMSFWAFLYSGYYSIESSEEMFTKLSVTLCFYSEL